MVRAGKVQESGKGDWLQARIENGSEISSNMPRYSQLYLCAMALFA
jgi:hypothetical protein